MASEPTSNKDSISTTRLSDEKMKMIHLDGRMLEGGGQLVRNAVALSALTGHPITISNIRGNRQGRTGLKGSHAAAIGFISDICQGEVVDGHVGSQKMTFYPRKKDSYVSAEQHISPKTVLCSRYAPSIKPEYNIHQKTAGSISLVFQALYPYLVYASRFSSADSGAPVKVNITGGTNVSFSPSLDYIDQVLAPNLRTLGLPKLGVKLHKRGWSTGPKDLGAVTFDVYPLVQPTGHKKSNWFPDLKLHQYRDATVTKVDITILAPNIDIQQLEAHGNRQERRRAKHEKARNYDYEEFPSWTIREYLEEQSQKSLRRAWRRLDGSLSEGTRPFDEDDDESPTIPIDIHLSEATEHHTHMYILLVAHMSNGLRLGSDAIFDGYEKSGGGSKGRHSGSSTIATLDNLVDRCVAGLVEELTGLKENGDGTTGKHQHAHAVDVHMRDQLVIFEALGLVGESARQKYEAGVSEKLDSEDERYWSLHTQTARWVCKQVLGQDAWNKT